eukprot:symbB.v1.2.041286.t1/scaffold8016.1/size8171/1
MASFECNICLEQASEPVVTRCGHLFCWACLHQWLNAATAAEEAVASYRIDLFCPNFLTEAHRSTQMSPSSSRGKTASACPICKASVTIQNVIPVYTRSNQSDPRNSYPNLPSRPPGERPEPEPASVLALQAFQNGGIPESYGYTSGQGFFPVIFGLNWQGPSLLEPPSTSKALSYSLLGLSLLYFWVLLFSLVYQNSMSEEELDHFGPSASYPPGLIDMEDWNRQGLMGFQPPPGLARPWPLRQQSSSPVPEAGASHALLTTTPPLPGSKVSTADPQYLSLNAWVPPRRCDMPLQSLGIAMGDDARSPDVRPLCPQPRRAFVPAFCEPGPPLSPSPVPFCGWGTSSFSEFRCSVKGL